jgi:hypothetical protein
MQQFLRVQRKALIVIDAALTPRTTNHANEVLTFKSLPLKKNLVDPTRLWSNTFLSGTDLRSRPFAKRQECPMTRPIVTRPVRILTFAITAAAALQLSLPSTAGAQQAYPGVKQQRRPTMSQNIGPNGYFPSQAAARAAHPITQGGTTGGTVNPGLTRDHMQHGYNG